MHGGAAENPDTVTYRFLADGENESATLTWAQVDLRARIVGGFLEQITKPGDRAIMLYSSGLEAIVAFLGCVYAGVAPVPALPLQPGRPPTAFLAMVKDAQADIILTTTEGKVFAEPLVAALPDAPALRWVSTDTLDAALAQEWKMPELTSDLPAFLIYTSGSTGSPRGVLRRQRDVARTVAMATKTAPPGLGKLLVWAPLYHGSGLMGAGLTPFMFRSELILMPPLAVMEKPLRWLKAISNFQVTSSGGPNFIFQYCVDRITPTEREGLDLSSWVSAGSGGEPVRMSTVEQFCKTYEPYGFKRESFGTGYGLTESGLQGTQSRGIKIYGFDRNALRENKVKLLDESDPAAVALVSCGHPIPTMKLKIVDPATCLECPPERVGEVWLSGMSVADGYWNNPEATEATFHAKIADTGEGPFLRTGDLGFLYEGELYIAGRIKETIIVHGRNYYAQDIESAVGGSHPAIQPAASAAFSVPVGAEERIVIFQELKPDAQNINPDEITQAMRRAAAETLGLSLYAVVLVKPGALPRTGMGKIQRYAVRKQYLDSQESEQLV
jgi:acyl-CoA synthetase (AMP-forming)/AMP-acid ligase II